MSRDANGNYTLPSSNPVITGTIIESDWANSTMSDIAASLTNSLSRNGEGGMLAPLKNVNGTRFLPAITWSADIQSGFYLHSPEQIYLSIATVPMMRWTPTAVEVWNLAESQWVEIGENAQSNLFAGPDPVLDILVPAADVAIVMGSDDPDNEAFIAAGPSLIQAKVGRDASAVLNLNTLGGGVNIGSMDEADSPTKIYDNGVQRMSFESNSVILHPSDSSGRNAITFMKSDISGVAAEIGFNSVGSSFNYVILKKSALVAFTATNAEGLNNLFLLAQPDFYPSLTNSMNVNMPRLSLNGGYVGDFVPALKLQGAGPYSSLDLDFDRIQNGDSLTLQGSDVGGDLHLGTDDPSAPNQVFLYHSPDMVAQTTSAATGGLEVNNLATGAGFERVLTESDLEPPAYAGFTGYKAGYLQNGSLADDLFDLIIAPDTWITVGPTGAPSLYTWTGLDSVPAEAKMVTVQIIGYFDVNDVIGCELGVQARKNGDTGNTIASNVFRLAGRVPDFVANTRLNQTVIVDLILDADNIIEIRYSSVNTTNDYLRLQVVGFKI